MTSSILAYNTFGTKPISSNGQIQQSAVNIPWCNIDDIHFGITILIPAFEIPTVWTATETFVEMKQKYPHTDGCDEDELIEERNSGKLIIFSSISINANNLDASLQREFDIEIKLFQHLSLSVWSALSLFIYHFCMIGRLAIKEIIIFQKTNQNLLFNHYFGILLKSG